MRLLVLFLFTTALEALEIEELPKEIIVDPKEILDGKQYEAFNVGYVTKRMQLFGYLNAKVVVQNEVMKAIPGDRYTIREMIIKKDGVPEVHTCEIAMTPDNMRLFQRIFADCDWDRSINDAEKSIRYTLTPK